MKYAVYVEGQSEMLFVADVLQKYSNYDPYKCGFLCINLTADDFERVPFPIQGSESSANYYQIVNVNNDTRVLSKMNKDIPGLIAQGYNVFIGLKDVYGSAYEGMFDGRQDIDRALIEKLYSIQNGVVDAHDSDCRLHYAIMEYEAWMLALIEQYIISKGKPVGEICAQVGTNIVDIDPEKHIYHPYPLVKQIFQACGEDYNKHSKESYSFLAVLGVDDYERLRHSEKCASFRKFLDSLLGGPMPSLP